jgi:hypothetical protein
LTRRLYNPSAEYNDDDHWIGSDGAVKELV